MNMKLASHATRLKKMFSASGISAVTVKGAGLAIQAFENLAGRQFSDIDILIAETDFLRAHSVLLNAGFSAYELHPHISPKQILKSRREIKYLNTAQIELDVHPCAVSHIVSKPESTGVFLELSRTVNIETFGTIQTLSIPAHLLLLCMNGSEEKWKKLSDIVDIAVLSQKMDIEDWRTVDQLAESLTHTLRLLTGLRIAALVFGIEMPERIQEKAQKSSKVDTLARSAIARLARGISTRPDGIRERIYSICCMDTKKQKLNAAFRYAFSPGFNEYSLIKLPQHLTSLYCGIRFIRVVQAALSGIFK